jgi:hypothetical protein
MDIVRRDPFDELFEPGLSRREQYELILAGMDLARSERGRQLLDTYNMAKYAMRGSSDLYDLANQKSGGDEAKRLILQRIEISALMSATRLIEGRY